MRLLFTKCEEKHEQITVANKISEVGRPTTEIKPYHIVMD